MRIDAFAHVLPVKYKDAFQSKLSQGAPMMSGGNWDTNRTLTDVDLRLGIMDEYEIDMQAVATPNPPLEWLFDAPTGTLLAQMPNDGVGEIVRRHPNRFIGIATVCLLDVDAAIGELERSIRELDLGGVLIGDREVRVGERVQREWPLAASPLLSMGMAAVGRKEISQDPLEKGPEAGQLWGCARRHVVFD